MRTLCVPKYVLAFSAACATVGLQAQSAAAPVEIASNTPAKPVSAPTSSAPSESDSAIVAADCGDPLSAALRVDGNDDMPCWANLRASERWNLADIPDGSGIRGDNTLHLPRGATSQFTVAAGGLTGTEFFRGDSQHAYAGVLGVGGFVDRERWKLSVEDSGALAGETTPAGNAFAGLNRGAARVAIQVSPRLSWQASAANTYGTDSLRLLAPFDERRIGTGLSSAELPVADAVAYGLHAGQVVDEQEDTHVRYEQTRRSNWEFAAGHTLQHYSDDGATIQTIRGRAEFLHSINPGTAFGVYGHTERQNGQASCTLTGGGVRSLNTWGERSSLNVSAAVSAADTGCGSGGAVFTGDAAFSVRASERTWVSFTANRGLSDGIVERVAILNTGVVGIRHSFHSLLDLRLSAAGIMGNDVLTKDTYTGGLASAAVMYPIGRHLTGETSLRHVQVTPSATGSARTVLTTTLWFSPGVHGTSR